MFVHKMDECYARDLEAFSKGEIADNRLRMMKEIERDLRSPDFARWSWLGRTVIVAVLRARSCLC